MRKFSSPAWMMAAFCAGIFFVYSCGGGGGGTTATAAPSDADFDALLREGWEAVDGFPGSAATASRAPRRGSFVV